MAKGVNERHIFSGSSRKNRIKLKIKYQNEKQYEYWVDTLPFYRNVRNEGA